MALTGSEAGRGARVTGSWGWQRVRERGRLRGGPAMLSAETLFLKIRMPSSVCRAVLLHPEMCVVKGDPNCVYMCMCVCARTRWR